MHESRPDIVMVMTDQHAARVMGCAGDPHARTPGLDAFAAQGTRFANAYCASPLCVPSRMAFLSGLEPHESGVLNNDTYLPSDIPTLAHALGGAGYDCHLVGRMHFNGPDQLHGFADRPIGDIGASYPGGTPPDIGALTKGRGNRGAELEYSGAGETSYQAYDHAVADHALVSLAQLKAARAAGGKPFFLLISLFCPHPPYIARRSDFDAFDDLPPPELAPPESDHPAIAAWRKVGATETVTPEAVRTSRQAYYGLVTMVDRIFGGVMEALGEAENTVTIYTSDHGECLGERGLWWKSVMYDQSVKVPMIVRGPGFAADVVDDRVCGLLDLSATILGLGQTGLPGQRGRDLRDVEGWENIVFSSYYGGLMNIATADVRHRMVRHGRFKLVAYDEQDPQLFDLRADPDELHNLSADPAHMGTRQELQALVRSGWDSRTISAQQLVNVARIAQIKNWVRATCPPEPYRWRDPDPGRNRYE